MEEQHEPDSQVVPFEVQQEEQRAEDQLGGTGVLVLLVCCALVLFSVPAMSYYTPLGNNFFILV